MRTCPTCKSTLTIRRRTVTGITLTICSGCWKKWSISRGGVIYSTARTYLHPKTEHTTIRLHSERRAEIESVWGTVQEFADKQEVTK